MKVPVLLLALLLPAAAAAQDYDACIARVGTDPHGALAQAEAWEEATRDPAASHCAAMALGALGRNRTAAARLADLAARPGPMPAETRAEMLEQASGFWIEGGEAGLARAALDSALRLAPDHPAALAARADLHSAEGRFKDAAADLDRAIARLPDNAALLTMRAAARRQAGEERAALADARAALALAPRMAAALFERGAAEAALGEPAAARESWLQAVAADPDSDAAARAQLSLQALDAP